MATEELKIVIDTVYKGASNARRAERDMDDLGDAANTSADKWQKYAAAAGAVGVGLTALATVARTTYAIVMEGLELENVERQFNALSGSIQTTADALLNEMRDATSGTISDFDLMASANQIMSLGLGGTQDEVVRLANVVGKLGWEMDTVTLTLANQSVARLDSLGLSMESVTGRAQELEAEGYAVDEAFRLAVLEAGEAKIALLGDTADTTAGSIARLTAQTDNMTDSFKLGAAQGAAPLIDMLDEMTVQAGFGGLGGAFEFLGQSITANLIPGMQTYTLIQQEAAEGTGVLSLALGGQLSFAQALTAQYMLLTNAIREFNDASGSTPGAKGDTRGNDGPYPPPPGGGSDQYDYATGTPSHPGGWANVGEYGPERMLLPPGARVQSTNVTHNNTQNMRLSNSRSVERIVSGYFRNKARRRTAVG